MVTTGAIGHAKLQSNRHHQQTNMQLFTGRMPAHQQILSLSLSILTTIFQVPCLAGFIEAKDDGGGEW